MKEINIQEILESKVPFFSQTKSKIARKTLIKFLSILLKVKEMNDFIKNINDKYNFDLIDSLFEYLDFTFFVSNKDKNKIPSEGRLIIVANHPLGGLDGLALLKAVAEVRKDVRVVANDVLNNIDNLSELFLPIDLFTLQAQRQNLLKIEEALKKEEVLIFFPAAEVSRFSFLRGIKDGKWQKGAVRMARKYNSPILPIKIEGKNSIMFYICSMLYKPISTFLLPRELFGQKSKSLTLKIGDQIASETMKNSNFNEKLLTKLLKKHLYNLNKKDGKIFNTENTIIHPVALKILKSELQNSIILGNTRDAKKIYLAEFQTSPNIIKEISRLREVTFRKVGEGTGNKQDYDEFDKLYKHIVLWDEDNLDIVGSYRLGVCNELINLGGIEAIYNSKQFDFSSNFLPYLNKSIELGRSFVQEKYWGSNALDYLWQGISAFLIKYPDTRYLFGSISISDIYPEEAKYLIVNYYKKWYSNSNELAIAKNKFNISKTSYDRSLELFNTQDHDKDFKILKNTLKNFNLSVPVLLRKYTEICEFGAATFIDFGIDVNFKNSIDCLILVDLAYLKEEFRNRYFVKKINSYNIKQTNYNLKEIELV